MPDYTVRDESTGRTVTFAWHGDAPPTDADMEEVFAAAGTQQPPAPPQPTAMIGPTTRGQRFTNTIQNLQGVPGILVGAANRALEAVAGAGDMARAGWNMLAPESMEVDRPNQDYQRPDTNPWQMAGVRAMQGAELAGGVKAATKVPGIVARGLGISKVRAGQNIADAANAAKGVPVTKVADIKTAGARAQQLQAAGGRMPRAATRLIAQIEKNNELTFQEAQDFASNLSRLSANEFNSLNPQMQRQIAEMTKALRTAITDAAETVGKGDQYAKGVSEYAKAARAAERWEKAKPALIKTLKGLAYAGAAGAGYSGLRQYGP